MPGASEEAKRDYEQALGAYERASGAVDAARSPQDLEPVGQAAEEGRYAMASARARLEGREPPERTPPCFFDPRHGPSAREVEWSPPWGEPRPVPACEADAQRVERGEDPDPREVTVGGQRVPYWNAGPGVRAVHGRLLRRRPAARHLPRLAARRRHVRRATAAGTASSPTEGHGAATSGGGRRRLRRRNFGGGDFGGDGDFGEAAATSAAGTC